MNSSSELYRIKKFEVALFRAMKLDDVEYKIKTKIPTPTQFQIIQYILKNASSGIYQKDLEKILNLRRATISGVLQTMEKNNLIKRNSISEDARTKIVLLTPKAKDIFKKCKKRINEIEEKMIDGISRKDLEVFDKVLEQMQGNLIKLNLVDKKGKENRCI